jgi:hypothetical protein
MRGQRRAVGVVGSASWGNRRSQIRGQVQYKLAMYDHVVVRLLKIARQHFCVHRLVNVPTPVQTSSTVAPCIKVDDASDADIDHAQEALVLFLELLLVEDLYS